MKVSLNAIKELTRVELPLDELVAKINAQLGGVEEVIDISKRYEDALVVKVVSAEQHPDADRLRVCIVDDGGVAEVPRDENGYVQVVCGAPNAVAGMWAVWLPPGSTVPASFDDKTPFVLGARELRGVMSQGMLAASDELGIGTDHDGIVELNENELKSPDVKLIPGISFAKTVGLDDYIIDIENKMFTHRPDLFGQIGVAREIAGITHQEFTSPDWYWKFPPFGDIDQPNVNFPWKVEKVEADQQLALDVFNDAPEKAPRFMALVMRNVQICPSPIWLQCRLSALGGKPINNVVDATNYIMLMTGQPTHAYDYAKLHDARLGVRMAQKGERVSLLNGKTYELCGEDIVIADGQGVVGLAGVMGGAESEVDENTKDIVLEVATFNMYDVRKATMRYGLFTDAATRFTKNQSPLQNDRIMLGLSELVAELAGAKVASNVYDKNAVPEKVLTAQTLHESVEVKPRFINDRLGLDLSEDAICSLLRNVEFACTGSEKSDTLTITAPFFRTDIQLPEDVVEEVGRLYGYEKLPRDLPSRSLRPVAKNTRLEVKKLVRQSLRRAGANELLCYSFVNKNTLNKAEQDIDQAFRVGNALSPDLQYFRLTVLPSLLERVHPNIKAGHDEFALFEIGKGHNRKYHLNDDEGLPRELNFIDIVYASKKPHEGAPYFRARRLLDQLAADLGQSFSYEPIQEPLDFPVTAPFDQSRSALVYTSQDHDFVGMIGELKLSVRRAFKLPDYTAAITLDTEGIERAYLTRQNAYALLSKFPSVTQDISLKVPNETKFTEVMSVSQDELASEPLSELTWQITPLSVYQSKNDPEHKTITLRIRLTSPDRTLKDAEATEILDRIAEKAKQTCQATRA